MCLCFNVNLAGFPIYFQSSLHVKSIQSKQKLFCVSYFWQILHNVPPTMISVILFQSGIASVFVYAMIANIHYFIYLNAESN